MYKYIKEHLYKTTVKKSTKYMKLRCIGAVRIMSIVLRNICKTRVSQKHQRHLQYQNTHLP